MLSADTLSGLDNPQQAKLFFTSYAERYAAGRPRGKKLVSLAEKLPSGGVRDAVCELASQELRTATDSVTYRRLCDIKTEPEAGPWLERVERENRVKRAQLDSSLNKARSEAGKEPTRLALKDLGVFFLESGDGASAVKLLFQGKDTASTPAQHLEMALLVMEAGLDYAKYDYASPFALKAEQLLPAAPHGAKPTNEALKVKVALGLCELDRRRYKQAAKYLLQVNSELRFSNVISVEDVTTIAVLCALATFSRSELKDMVVDHATFKGMLETVPAVKELLNNFSGSRYGPVTRILNQALPVLFLDPFLQAHAETLLRDIKVQALLQCVAPYSCVKLAKMAAAFETDIPSIENDLAQLISNGQVQARIDSQNKILIARGDDKRDVAVSAALEASQTFVREAKSMLLRLNLLENAVVYNPPKPRGQGPRAPSMMHPGAEEFDGESGDEEMWDGD